VNILLFATFSCYHWRTYIASLYIIIYDAKPAKVTKQVFGVTIEVTGNAPQAERKYTGNFSGKQQQQMIEPQPARNPFHSVTPLDNSPIQPIHLQASQGVIPRTNSALSNQRGSQGSSDSLNKEARISALKQAVIGTMEKSLTHLATLKNQIAQINQANEFVPFMARYKAIKEEADKFRAFVDSPEITPSNQDSMTERAREMLTAGIRSIELLFHLMIDYLNSSHEQQEILNIGSTVNQIHKKLEVVVNK